MKEIAKTKIISIWAPPASFTRISNAMMQDAQDAFGENVPDEVTTAFDLIRRQTEAEEEYRVDNTCPMVFGVADKLHVIQECRVWFFVHHDSDSYILDYYFFSNSIYEKWYFGKFHCFTDYQELVTALYRQKGKLRYFCTQRPPTRGGIPDGFVTYESYPNSRFRGEWCPGEITYNRPPPKDELWLYGLRLDPDWEQERNRYLGANEGSDKPGHADVEGTAF